MIYNNITELIGKTPLVKINGISGDKGKIYAKLEYFNPLHSVKDRIGLAMIEDAEEKGLLKSGMTVIEPTSGNTGIALAYVSAVKKYECVLVMPESMSMERRKVLRFLGAEVILTPAEKGMKGAIDEAERIFNESPEKYFMPMQFANPSNPLIHERTTAIEIWNDTKGEVDTVVAGIGTGGTITGIARALKKLKPEIQIVGVEPASSPVITKGEKGSHKIQGIGAGFIPEILELDLIDKIITVEDDDAFASMKQLAQNEGIFAGISSGAAFYAAMQVAEENKLTVVILPDTGERYMSVTEVL